MPPWSRRCSSASSWCTRPAVPAGHHGSPVAAAGGERAPAVHAHAGRLPAVERPREHAPAPTEACDDTCTAGLAAAACLMVLAAVTPLLAPGTSAGTSAGARRADAPARFVRPAPWAGAPPSLHALGILRT
ncbi:hypothetical protein [Isoptericola variabilis]|uniref:hypothetical protein n=1 Tax=Isoptericola variabilis TaxID=139208 RepID=UPI001644D49C|nr:hypothetical protein [Isoptericola variabilis]